MASKKEELIMTTATYIKGELYKLNITDLQPDPHQARKFIDPLAINDLVASIFKFGVMVPIQFRQNEQGALVIVSGHRRVIAAGNAGLTEIYGTFTDGDTRMQGFVENLQRENLAPVDEAEQMATLMKDYVFSQYQLADALGKSQPGISKTLTLNKLPVDIRDACRTNLNIPKTALLEIAKMKTDTSMRRKFEVYMTKASKEGQLTARKPRSTKQGALVAKLDKMASALDGLRWSEWSEKDRNNLMCALTDIRNKIVELSNALNQQPVVVAVAAEAVVAAEPVNPGGPNPSLNVA